MKYLAMVEIEADDIGQAQSVARALHERLSYEESATDDDTGEEFTYSARVVGRTVESLT